MRVSRDILKVVIVQHYEKDDPTSEAKIIVLPCRTEKAAKEFEKFYKEKFPPTQLLAINVVDSNVYG